MIKLVLGTISPREQNGRDTFARYKAQVRSAAIAALAILEGKIDRVYCDIHDDFVIRYKEGNNFKYSFFQVKTKDKLNSNWSTNKIFGLNQSVKSPVNIEKIRDSFAGKMFLHTVNFPNNCSEIVFQTNITLNEKANQVVSDIISGKFSEKHPKILLEKFQEIIGDTETNLSPAEIKKCLSKFRVEADVQYIKNKDHRFDSYAKDYIYEYSEIELSRKENEIILLKLVDLISKKSEGVIEDYNEDSIESKAGVSIDDLLKVLSISKTTFEYLKENGDSQAIKNVSFMQRVLLNSDANHDQLTYCARCKVKWDKWWRENRHPIPEHIIFSLTSRVNQILSDVVKMNKVEFSTMTSHLEILKTDLENSNMLFDLSMDELIGAFFSELSKAME